jgi:hypothetical protein
MLRELFHQILNPINKVHQLASGNIIFRSPCIFRLTIVIKNRVLHNINQEFCLIRYPLYVLAGYLVQTEQEDIDKEL